MWTQRGRNNLYPESIETWKQGETVPEWLSDRAKVEMVDLGNADKILKTSFLSSGGYEIYEASGKSVLVRVPEDGYVKSEGIRFIVRKIREGFIFPLLFFLYHSVL